MLLEDVAISHTPTRLISHKPVGDLGVLHRGLASDLGRARSHVADQPRRGGKNDRFVS
jgi:hypothetical protein